VKKASYTIKRISGAEEQAGLPKTWLFVVFGFGVAAFLVRWAGLTIPVLGSKVNTDPREIFVTLGAAFTGPVGGLVIGFLSGLPSVTMVGLASGSTLVAHVVSGLLTGLLYRPVYKRWPMPALLLGWAVLIAAHYYVFLIPTFLVLAPLIDPGGLSSVFGAELSFSEAYSTLGQAAFPEVVATYVITTIILIALPERHRRPLW
jgi:LytS/YehU family sensor histidine kinase